jgi:hypothetical protein
MPKKRKTRNGKNPEPTRTTTPAVHVPRAPFGGPLVRRTRGHREGSPPSLEQVEFSLDRGDALELHVERVLNFRKRSFKRLANLFDRRLDAVEPITRGLDGRPIASC